jgi:hypothetical protein
MSEFKMSFFAFKRWVNIIYTMSNKRIMTTSQMKLAYEVMSDRFCDTWLNHTLSEEEQSDITRDLVEELTKNRMYDDWYWDEIENDLSSKTHNFKPAEAFMILVHEVKRWWTSRSHEDKDAVLRRLSGNVFYGDEYELPD